MSMPMQGGGGGMYYAPPPPDFQGPRGGGFHSRSPGHMEPDFHRGRPRSESRGGGGYDRFRGRGPGGNRSRSRSPPRGGDGGNMQRQHRPSGEWERYDEAVPQKERNATQAIEPMDSYKVFMMRQDENSTPETYQQRYEEYKKKYVQRLMRAFFEDHKKEEWLQERYSPAIRHRLDIQKRSKKITEAKSFGERVRNGTAKICLDENAELPNKDFDNDMEDSTRILYIRRIPCACPVTSLSESIKKAGGNFQQIFLSDPVKKSAFDFDRSAYIIYDTPEAAAEALPKIHNTFVQDADIFAPFRLQVSQHRSRAPLKTPSYLSVPERLLFDYAQALQLASALDKCVFVKDADRKRYGIEALLEHDDVAPVYESEKQKLDVVVAYLRRVHHYIYYAGVQCIDMGDIMHAHPALFCRPEPTARDLEEEKARQESSVAGDESVESKSIGGWAASLDEKVQAYIKELEPSVLEEKREKDQALVDEIEAREEAALESTYANYCEKAGDDGKHRCRLCTKLFKAADFVKKHIRNKHPELVVDKIAEVGESYMWEQYREDANRPLPPIETTNNLSNPVLGGRGGPNSFQNRGGGGRSGPYGGPPRGGYRNDGPPGGGYRGRGPPRDNRPRRGSFDRGGPPRSPPRYNNNRPPPDGDLPVDPRQITKSYQDLDNLQDTKVELSFDALDSLPPPKKKTKV
uniref:C2H2-type domain-containing protein n=1 Tax=Globisporangium ultimum (strain ATCC 200006 / CBS 805.95 / DAOM BR144) TaxID=431595 RepID=K3WBH7_GLOUD